MRPALIFSFVLAASACGGKSEDPPAPDPDGPPAAAACGDGVVDPGEVCDGGRSDCSTLGEVLGRFWANPAVPERIEY